MLPASQGRDPSPLLSTGETNLECCAPGLVSPGGERHSYNGESCSKGHRDDGGTGVSLLWAKAGRPGALQSGAGQAQGDLPNVDNQRWEGLNRSQAFLSGVQWTGKQLYLLRPRRAQNEIIYIETFLFLC